MRGLRVGDKVISKAFGQGVVKDHCRDLIGGLEFRVVFGDDYWYYSKEGYYSSTGVASDKDVTWVDSEHSFNQDVIDALKKGSKAWVSVDGTHWKCYDTTDTTVSLTNALEYSWTLTEPVKIKKAVECWMNMLSSGNKNFYPTEKKAKDNAYTPNLYAAIAVKLTGEYET